MKRPAALIALALAVLALAAPASAHAKRHHVRPHKRPHAAHKPRKAQADTDAPLPRMTHDQIDGAVRMYNRLLDQSENYSRQANEAVENTSEWSSASSGGFNPPDLHPEPGQLDIREGQHNTARNQVYDRQGEETQARADCLRRAYDLLKTFAAEPYAYGNYALGREIYIGDNANGLDGTPYKRMRYIEPKE